MNRRILETILNRSDTEDMLFRCEDMPDWPDGTLDRLLAMRLLRAASPVSAMDCSDCERGCLAAPVTMVARQNGMRQAYIECPVHMRVEKPIESLKRWQVDIGALATLLADALGVRSEELMPGRLWMLGSVETGGARTDVLLARGLRWPDGERILREARSRKRSQAAVLLAPASAILADSFEIAPLGEVLSVNGNTLRVDVPAIQQAAERAQAAVAAASIGRPEGSIFRREGQRWRVVYGGQQISLNHSDGATYIAYLLEHPNTPLHVRELYAIAHPSDSRDQPNPYVEMNSDELAADDLCLDNESSPTDNRDDAELFATYRRSRDELQRELAEAQNNGNSSKADELQTELDTLDRLMSAEFGLDGRPRQSGDPNKQAYDRVSKAIARTYKTIENDHPALFAHLRNAIHYETFTYRYSPECPIVWDI